MSEHTPLPLVLTQRDSIPFTYEIKDAAGVVVLSQDIYAYSSGTRSAADAMDGAGFKSALMRADVIAANAQQRARLDLIVHSVNLLPELVEALREARVYVHLAVQDDGGIDNCEIGDRLALERIDALLAKATS